MTDLELIVCLVKALDVAMDHWAEWEEQVMGSAPHDGEPLHDWRMCCGVGFAADARIRAASQSRGVFPVRSEQTAARIASDLIARASSARS